MKKTNLLKQKQKGFTLIETLVAIFILLISTTGPLTFAQSGLRASFVARDQVVAFYLAQDAIETIKSMRNNSSIVGQDWLEGIPASCLDNNDDDGCRMETSSTIQFDDCSASGCEPMKFDDNTKQFTLSDGIDSKYTRTIYIKEIVENQEVQIIVEVIWDTNFFSDRRIIVQENIFNWVPNFTT